MKKTALLAISFAFMTGSVSFAGYDFGDCGACSMRPACGTRCIYDTPCQCADLGVHYNPCIDRCTYCEVFGNIGAR